MAGQKPRSIQKPGYRNLRTAAEQRFWDSNVPDFREWARKRKLTVDEAAALCMGLDPWCLPSIGGQKGATYARFLATKRWFLRNNKHFPNGRLDLESICVLGVDNGKDSLNLPDEMGKAIDLKQDGSLDVHRKIARLERRIERLKSDNNRLYLRFGKKVGVEKATTKSAVSNLNKTDAKIIVALAAGLYSEVDWPGEFQKLKGGQKTSLVKRINDMLMQSFGGTIDQDTILSRLRRATEEFRMKNGRLMKEDA